MLTKEMADEVCNVLNEDRQFGIRSDEWIDSAIAAVKLAADPVTLLCIRDPDADNSYVTDNDASVNIIDMDLGRSFDGSPDDIEEWESYASSIRAEIAHLPETSNICQTVEETLANIKPSD